MPEGVWISGLEANLLLHLLDPYIAQTRNGHPPIPGYGDAAALADLRERLFRARRHPAEDEDDG